MDKYKLEKLRIQLEEVMLEYCLNSHSHVMGKDVPSIYYHNVMTEYLKLRSKYFAALDEMSQKEGAGE